MKDIEKKHKQVVTLSEEKVNLAHKLYNCIDQPTEQLDRDISNQTRQQINNIS